MCYELIKKKFFKDFIYLFLESGGGKDKKRGRETLMCSCLSHTALLGTWLATQTCAQTGNQTGDPLVRRPALIPLGTPARAELISWEPPCLVSEAVNPQG